MSPSGLNQTISPAHAAAARDVCYHSIASLTFLVWYAIVTLDDEVQYIWTMRNTNIFKWVYFFLRYVVILAHVTHNVFIKQLADGSNPPIHCTIWFIYSLGFSQVLATLLELILATRVFALYNRSRRIAFLVLILILTETGGSVRILWQQQYTDFHGMCLLIKGSLGSKYQTIFGFIIHCTLIGLTLIKYFFALRAGWGRAPLVSLVVRDNSTVYATILFLVISVVIMCGLERERAVAIILFVIIIFGAMALLMA
ncbi:hypothetical protein JVT61DRAFT_4697 [Boletus reticuloceps]|uniref:DUF6533 domain-containing protein n=1 Tax=Boletus reticuloceps TaxID=495285 RepID=A0A8I2YLY2_9AGAM|nr:hypothetical protein JVT61DRAFT_4697 [Boletus reticuloceps]